VVPRQIRGDERLSKSRDSTIHIQSFTELEQFDDCVALEEAIWGYDPADMIPRRVFLLASRIGGQVLGAFDTDRPGSPPIGFAMALPGYRNGHAYLHSHMVGVLPEHRNRGIARALKLAQREDALARGIELMEWTFDPLEIKNAHLNIAKLGAIVRRYQHNFYGPSSCVERALSNEPQSFDVVGHVDVPAEIYAWKASPPDRVTAREIQARNASALEAAFARNLSILGYQRNDHGDGRFLLGHWDESFAY